jgi:hypothetical protein
MGWGYGMGGGIGGIGYNCGLVMVELRYIHFSTYALVFTLYGCVVTAVGPIILYFSEVTGHDET